MTKVIIPVYGIPTDPQDPSKKFTPSKRFYIYSSLLVFIFVWWLPFSVLINDPRFNHKDWGINLIFISAAVLTSYVFFRAITKEPSEKVGEISIDKTLVVPASAAKKGLPFKIKINDISSWASQSHGGEVMIKTKSGGTHWLVNSIQPVSYDQSKLLSRLKEANPNIKSEYLKVPRSPANIILYWGILILTLTIASLALLDAFNQYLEATNTGAISNLPISPL